MDDLFNKRRRLFEGVMNEQMPQAQGVFQHNPNRIRIGGPSSTQPPAPPPEWQVARNTWQDAKAALKNTKGTVAKDIWKDSKDALKASKGAWKAARNTSRRGA